MAQLTRDTMYWISYDDRQTLVKDLEVRHLVNIINHTKECNINEGRNVYSKWIIDLLEEEAELRIMAGWAANTGIPRRNKDATWTLINQSANEKAVNDAKTAIHRQNLHKIEQQIQHQPVTQ